MTSLKTFCLTIFIIYSLILATACPARSDIERAYKVSEASFNTVEISATNVGDLFTAKVISYETKEKLIAGLRKVQEKCKMFHAQVDAIYQIHKSQIPADKLAFLDAYLNREVLAPFAQILTEIGVLPPEVAEKVLLAITVARQALFTLASFFVRARGSSSASFQFYSKEVETYV